MPSFMLNKITLEHSTNTCTMDGIIVPSVLLACIPLCLVGQRRCHQAPCLSRGVWPGAVLSHWDVEEWQWGQLICLIFSLHLKQDMPTMPGWGE